MPGPATKATSTIQTLGVVRPDFIIEPIVNPNHPDQLTLHTWDGCTAKTAATINYRGCFYEPAPLEGGLARAVRFPPPSRSFRSAAKLVDSMLAFLHRYAHLSPDVACLLVALVW